MRPEKHVNDKQRLTYNKLTKVKMIHHYTKNGPITCTGRWLAPKYFVNNILHALQVATIFYDRFSVAILPRFLNFKVNFLYPF